MAVYWNGRKNEIVGITKKEKTVRLKFLKFRLRKGKMKMKKNNVENFIENVLERIFVAVFSGLAVWALYIAFADTVTGFQELWHMLGR